MLIGLKIVDHYNKFFFIAYSIKMNREIKTFGDIDIEICEHVKS